MEFYGTFAYLVLFPTLHAIILKFAYVAYTNGSPQFAADILFTAVSLVTSRGTSGCGQWLALTSTAAVSTRARVLVWTELSFRVGT